MRTVLWTIVVVSILVLGSCAEEHNDDDGTLELQVNERNELSCWLRWHTDEPGTSRVEFGEGGTLEFYVADDQLVLDHEVFVPGFYADAEFTLKATSADAAGETTWTAETVYKPEPLPFAPFVVEATIVDEQNAWTGWTLAVVTALEDNESTLLMFDMEGRPRWFYRMEDLANAAGTEAHLAADSSILLGGAVLAGKSPIKLDLTGATIWEGPVQPEVGVYGFMHHTFQQIQNGNYLTLISEFEDGRLFDVVVELDETLNTVHSWSTEDLFAEQDTSAWGNAALVDLDGGFGYYNSRHNHTLYKYDRDSGDVIWALGAGGDFEMTTAHDEPWLGGQHAPEIHGDGTILFMDNGWNQRTYSRVIEYSLDTERMEASIAWEYPGELAVDEWYNSTWGDANRLPNGNTLITAGSMINGESPSRIFEVMEDGTLVWELMILPNPGYERAGAYMADRITPLVSRIEE